MTLLLDTHFLVWILLGSKRLRSYPWLVEHRPWGVSPVSLLEIQFLAEVGRLTLDAPAFFETLQGDARFRVDDPPLAAVVRQSLALSWTRDPFDRLLAAHSTVRRFPLCTTDAVLTRHHPSIVKELRDRRP
jgi:PIN domain nuclease of toxin-antitoxin system